MPFSPAAEPEALPHTQLAPRWQLILLDDDDHSYEYVVTMLTRILGMSATEAWEHAREVDTTGASVVFTGPREQAEFHQERIHAWGPDPRIARCAGSMTACLEPLD